ncbi:MAG: tRNA (N(6)-L-threonylcarbamoyladenosine(37)-C(2))-methylthiotransferase MtaB [Armatimonadota bacterium]
MPRVALHTLGCKVNQYETQKISEEFRSRGFILTDSSNHADIYIINTCTVTQVADSKSRQIVRSLINKNPDAIIVMTGCYAETSPESASAIEGVSLVVRNSDKSLLVDKVLDILPETVISDLSSHADIGQSSISGRTRALLKIQDGCDQFCSYCAVPYARSVMWSRPVREILEEANDLASRGFKEIVLTGIRIGRYQDDDVTLTHLLEQLVLIGGIERIRISSIESTDVPDGMLELMSQNRKICRHLHVPLQSGDDSVLKRMNRPYTTAQFFDFIQQARKMVPCIAITTDIIVGFPGETQQNFDDTCEFVKDTNFSRSHIFRYSPRSGTVAAELSDAVPETEKERRSAQLIKLTTESAAKFAENLKGTRVSVLIEGKKVGKNLRSGLTDTYVRVHLEAGSEMVGCIVDAVVKDVIDGKVYGEII